MTLWEALDARAKRREARHRFLVERGLDLRSLARMTFEKLDPRLFVAFTIIGLFGWAFARNTDNETMVGALIAAFAGAWGYYLGSSNSANQANDRADRGLEVVHDAIRQMPTPPPPAAADVELEPGERATVSAAGEEGSST